jgi:hypothetical protein
MLIIVAGMMLLAHTSAAVDALTEAQIDAFQGKAHTLTAMTTQSRRDVLVREWTLTAAATVRDPQVRISRESALLFSGLIQRGASEFAKEPRTSKDAERAEAHLKRFTEALLKNGERTPQGIVEISEATYSKTRKSLCPLWPFC